jgi:hypothetical protein
LFFANCEGFHGEACSVFAGPYSVTHHKSSLLIAALTSFYNAGSGTNQSNHMYKLGPVHEGKLERGSKTGSFAYMMWPCRVGPFSIVLGKHTRNFDSSQFPFSVIEARPDGRCALVPGLNYATVGLVRDGAKWPARDRRKGAIKRDRINFDVFSPFTVGRMLTGSAILQHLQETTEKSVDSVTVHGADIKRVLLRTGQKFYRSAIEMYLCDKVVSRIEAALAAGARSLQVALATPTSAVYSEDWVDIAGQLMPRRRLEDLGAAIESGQVADVAGFFAALDQIAAAYADDEWVWVKQVYRQVFKVDLDAATTAQVTAAADGLQAGRTKYLKQILADATKEYDALSHIGFGHDGSGATDTSTDFTAVRGDYDSNKFVKDIRQQMASLEQHVARFKRILAEM